jgi:DNA repair exonuclease SbcCD ATPase subunit
MINRIELFNFQSHKESKLEFVPGINAIIGSSDSGKSSILRGMLWAIYNRPSGDVFVSHWARDKKGKQNDGCSVTILKYAQGLTRLRTAGHNEYIFHNEKHPDIKDEINVFEAIRTDVPEQVSDFFNLSEVNIQKQMDSPFLLSESSGEVARFFNRIIKLDEIDKALSLIDKKKRECDKKIKDLKTEQGVLTEDLEDYNWIEGVEGLLNKAEKIQDRIEGKRKDTEFLGVSLGEWEESACVLKKTGSLIELEGDIVEVELLNDKIIEKEKQWDKLESSIGNYNGFMEVIARGESLLKQGETIEKAIEIHDNIEKLIAINDLCFDSIEEYEGIRKKISIIDKEIKEMEIEMPNVCPMCSGTGRLK